MSNHPVSGFHERGCRIRSAIISQQRSPLVRIGVAVLMIMCIAAMVLTANFPRASAASSWPPRTWSAAAHKAVISVLAPKSLSGLTLRRGVFVSPYEAHCQSVSANYTLGGQTLAIVELPPNCGNLGAVQTVGTVRVGSHLARILSCNPAASPGCRPVPSQLVWSSGHIEIDITWTGGLESRAIGLARSMAVVPRSRLSYLEALDESVVAAKNFYCPEFSSCPFAVASTTDGHGHDLIAVDLLHQGGTACSYPGIVYFFEGTSLKASTLSLAPRAGVWPGSRPLWADGTAKFAVRYQVTPSSNAICALWGSSGTDTYVYRWNGTRFVVASGALPRPPKVLT